MPRYSEVRGRELTKTEEVLERFAMSRAGYRFLLHVAPRIDKVLLPRTKGVWSSTGKNTVALVVTVGARTGQRRAQPLVVMEREDGSLLLVGSNYGRPQHPGWSHNLIANPECEVTFRGETKTWAARLLEGSERQAAWDTAVDWYAGYAGYATNCHPREIRVFRLDPLP